MSDFEEGITFLIKGIIGTAKENIMSHFEAPERQKFQNFLDASLDLLGG